MVVEPEEHSADSWYGGVLRIFSEIIFLISQRKCCGPSLEPSGQVIRETTNVFVEKYGRPTINYPYKREYLMITSYFSAKPL